MKIQSVNNDSKAELDWVNVIFLTSTPFLAIALVILYFKLEVFNPWMVLLFFVFYILTGIAMTGGYHRLYSHLAYKASKPLELFYLLAGAAAFQNSVVFWADDHRRHHRFVDTDKDPYNAKRGLWFSHMAWIFYKDSYKQRNIESVPDLARNPLVMWQHKYYWPLAITLGFGLPTLIGWLMGSALGGFVFGGLLRIVVVHHFIFFINSLAHYWGKQPYTDQNTSRDNIVLAFFTYGEGYHNFHHIFENDYRNGITWYSWDPTKWWIRFMAWLGFAKDLKRVSETVILRARLAMDKKRLMMRAPDSFQVVSETLDQLQAKILELKHRVRLLKIDYRARRKQLHEQGAQRIEEIKNDLRRTRTELKYAYAQWRATLATVA